MNKIPFIVEDKTDSVVQGFLKKSGEFIVFVINWVRAIEWLPICSCSFVLPTKKSYSQVLTNQPSNQNFFFLFYLVHFDCLQTVSCKQTTNQQIFGFFVVIVCYSFSTIKERLCKNYGFYLSVRTYVSLYMYWYE